MTDIKCLHCGVTYNDSNIPLAIREIVLESFNDVAVSDVDGNWAIRFSECPVCKKATMYLLNVELKSQFTSKRTIHRINKVISETLVRPIGRNRSIPFNNIPIHIAQDYKEACLVLPYSPKASAALSRRCLQNLLRDSANVKPSDLYKEIQEAMDSGKLPSHLAESIDAIRNIGNFAAHPMKSKGTGEIVDVEPEEAEWNLDVIESLFDFYYVQPAKVAQKREALNAKLQEAGKPPMK